MRSGELAGLQWKDVDFEGKCITVRRQVVKGKVQSAKANKVRKVDLSSALLEALRALKRKRREEYFAKGKNEIPPWVFPNREGKPLDMHNVKNPFHAALQSSGSSNPL